MIQVDAELLARIRSGDPNAFRSLVEAYDRMVTALLVDRVGMRDEVHDLRQEVFFRIYKGLASLRSDEKFSSWVRGICRNVVREYWNARARAAGDLEEVGEPEAAPPIDDEAASIEYAISRAMHSLPARYREVLRLRYYAKMDYEEIADALGLTLMAVDGLMRRAKSRLKEAVTPILERENLK